MNVNIESISWLGVGVPFRRPFTTSAGTVGTRFSLLIWVRTDSGVTGVGEAPVPFGEGEEGLLKLADAVDPATSNPSLTFALETADLDALGKLKKQPVATLLGGKLQPVSTNAVIGSASPQDAAHRARQAVADGFSTLKLKVGARPIDEEEQALRAVRSAVGPDIKLRLDANQAWTTDEVLSNVRRLAPFQPEYIEEPATGDVLSGSPVPIAADESVSTREDALRIIESRAADVLILKAARLGGLRPTKEIGNLAAAAGIRAVLTSNLETGVGLAASLHLAAALLPSEVHGLATGALLEHDLLTTPLLPKEGQLSLPPLPGLGVTLDTNALDRYKLDIRGVTG